MLDHQNGVLGRNALDQRRDLVDVLMAMPAIGSSSSIISGSSASVVAISRARFAPIGHLDGRRVGKFAQADIVQQFERAAVETVEHGLGAPEIERRAVLALQRDAYVLERRQCGNTAEIWNERTRPRRATSAGAIAVMSLPL